MRLTGRQQYDLFPDLETGLDKLAVDIGGISLTDAAAKDERTEDEKFVAGLIGKGEMYYYSGENDKALSCFETAFTIQPDDYKAWNNKGSSLFYLGRHEEAIQASNKALEIEPDLVEAWKNKCIVFSLVGRDEEAQKAFDNAKKILTLKNSNK